MNSENIKWFIWSYVLLAAAIFFAFIGSTIVCGLFTGLAVFSRKMVGGNSSKSGIELLQEIPGWKWFSVIYLFILLTWLIKNMGNDYLSQFNSVFAVSVFMLPFIVPYALNEYKIYKDLKTKINH